MKEIEQKQCSCCKNTFPKTDEFFYVSKRKTKKGFIFVYTSNCRYCYRDKKTQKDLENGIKEAKIKRHYETGRATLRDLTLWYDSIEKRGKRDMKIIIENKIAFFEKKRIENRVVI